jgi:hypothetical protein
MLVRFSFVLANRKKRRKRGCCGDVPRAAHEDCFSEKKPLQNWPRSDRSATSPNDNTNGKTKRIFFFKINIVEEKMKRCKD